jgi:hypothetical protein
VARRDGDLTDLLSRLGRRSVALSIDDVAAAVADVMKNQKRDLIAHMQRMIQLERVNSRLADARARNLHARLTVAEAAIRGLQRDRSR